MKWNVLSVPAAAYAKRAPVVASGENMIVRLRRVLQSPKCGSIYCNGGCD
jgi:hypothetical protein